MVAVRALALIVVTALVVLSMDNRNHTKASASDQLAAPDSDEPESGEHRERSRLARRASMWQPTSPRPALRVLARAWASPMTIAGRFVAIVGAASPAYDDRLDVWIAVEPRGLVGQLMRRNRIAGIAIGEMIIFRDSDPSDELIRHEMIHVNQQRSLGPLFLIPYYGWTMTRGYHDNPFEIAARAAE